MLCQLLVLLFVSFERFLLPFFESAMDILLLFVDLKRALNHKEIFTVFDVLRIYGIEIALAKTEVVYRIQDIGFTHSVVSDQAIDAFREIEHNLCMVFKIYDRQRL